MPACPSQPTISPSASCRPMAASTAIGSQMLGSKMVGSKTIGANGATARSRLGPSGADPRLGRSAGRIPAAGIPALALALLAGAAFLLATIDRLAIAVEIEPRDVKDRAPGEPIPEDEADALRLKSLEYRLLDWDDAAVRTRDQGVRIRARLLPDALAHKTCSAYLDLRRRGLGHQAAVDEVAKSIPRWKRYDGMCGFLVELESERPALAGGKKRVYTLEKSLEKEGVRIEVEKEGQAAAAKDASGRGSRAGAESSARPAGPALPLRLAGNPSGLRLAQLRVKKFWSTADGSTRRVRRAKDPARSDPLSFGREPLLGKPFTALVLENEPARFELLTPRQIVEKSGADGFRLELRNWKRYEGPFIQDSLDLNENRPWDPLRPISVIVVPPPAGLSVNGALQDLVDECKEAARGLP